MKRKIYNEVVIDMNPESSSYGETLHEDFEEYDGPMALCTDLRGITYPGGGTYYNHTDHGNFWIIETRPADYSGGMFEVGEALYHDVMGTDVSGQFQFHIMDKSSKSVIESYPSVEGNASGMSYSQALESGTTAYNDWSAMQAGGEGYGLKTAEEISFSDWSPYFDDQGNIKEGEVENFQDFLSGIDDYFDKDNIKHSTFKALVSTIPKDIVPKEEAIDKSKGSYMEGVITSSKAAASARRQKMSQMSQQGTYSAFADDSSLHQYYQPLHSAQGGESLMYGAAGESTQRLLDWMKETAGEGGGDAYSVYTPSEKSPTGFLSYEEGQQT